MEILLNQNKVKIDNFTITPNVWIWDSNLSDGDKIKLLKLYWRYDFFRSLAYENAKKSGKKKIKATNYLYDTQEAYGELLGIPRNKVSTLFKRLEEQGFIVRIKCGVQKVVDGSLENVPRDYLVVLNPCHKDYHQDLEDVWEVLSKRLSSLKEKGKENQITYKSMEKVYKRLFGDRGFYEKPVYHTPIEDEDVNFGILYDIDINEPPKFEIPIEAYMDDYYHEDFEQNEEISYDYVEDYLNIF